ncbi:hypothetical protein RIF29_15416 [Crotalaria pallida]|uniref:Uncharacterized protein n=1 Tax=Crotalaria pallida TaxID=3830 RepID=A0AAN9FD45_CROPI
MGSRKPSIRRASFSATQATSKRTDIPKGYLAVYAGDQMKRLPSFQGYGGGGGGIQGEGYSPLHVFPVFEFGL